MLDLQAQFRLRASSLGDQGQEGKTALSLPHLLQPDPWILAPCEQTPHSCAGCQGLVSTVHPVTTGHTVPTESQPRKPISAAESST